MLHVLCGVEVVTQHEVRDENGAFVARGDLWIRGTRCLQEYDGSTHREPGRHRQDLLRERRLSAAGWTRHGYTSQEVVHQARGILRDAEGVTGRPVDPTDVRTWHRHLAESLITPAGRTRLLQRMVGAPRAPPRAA